MKLIPYRHERVLSLLSALGSATTALVRFLSVAWAKMRGRVLVFMWLLGFLVQVFLIFLAQQLVDICISLLELWLELAQRSVELSGLFLW